MKQVTHGKVFLPSVETKKKTQTKRSEGNVKAIQRRYLCIFVYLEFENRTKFPSKTKNFQQTWKKRKLCSSLIDKTSKKDSRELETEKITVEADDQNEPA